MEQNEQPQTNTPAELTISDLQNIKSIIETTVRRGAFQAQELSAVGAVFDKLHNFLSSVSNQSSTTT